MSDIQPVHKCDEGLFNTVSGVKVSIHNPVPEMFNIRDIARGLANTCRFGGQVPRFYSVAQHSVYVAILDAYNNGAPSASKLGLLHDATEAYLGDVIKPLKNVLGRAYEDIEDKFERVIFDKYGLQGLTGKDCKQADMTLLEAEYKWAQYGDPAIMKFLHDNHVIEQMGDTLKLHDFAVWDSETAEAIYLKVAGIIGITE